MSWDRFQRDALEAMGYRLYAVQGAHAPAGEEPAASPHSSAVVAGETATIDVATDAPLLRALLRASGRSVDDADALALCRGLLAAGGLRDAASRRALWPRLRALRARQPG